MKIFISPQELLQNVREIMLPAGDPTCRECQSDCSVNLALSLLQLQQNKHMDTSVLPRDGLCAYVLNAYKHLSQEYPRLVTSSSDTQEVKCLASVNNQGKLAVMAVNSGAQVPCSLILGNLLSHRRFQVFLIAENSPYLPISYIVAYDEHFDFMLEHNSVLFAFEK